MFLILCILCAGCGQGSPREEDALSALGSPIEPSGEGVETAGASLGQEGESVRDSETNSESEKDPGQESGGRSAGVPGGASETSEGGKTQEGTHPKFSLIMVGDILLHTPVEESAVGEDGARDFSPIFSNVAAEIADADLALVNQEVIIGGEELGISGYPAFNAPYEAGDALAEAGFDVVCHATNHALDKGRRGLLNCLDFWRTRHPDIAVLGIAGSSEQRDEIYVCEQDGMRVAILNYTYGTNGIALPEDMPFGVNLLQEEQVVSDLQRADREADFVIVCPHWGTEYSLEASAEQERWVQIFLENGVDLVLGTHPHVIEPIEWKTDEDTGRQMLVYYSLGNFVNWTSGEGDGVANRMVGGMARVTLEQDGESGVFISEHDVLPLVCHVEDGPGGVRVYALEDYDQELAAQNEIVKQDPHFSLEYCAELCRKVWGPTYAATY